MLLKRFIVAACAALSLMTGIFLNPVEAAEPSVALVQDGQTRVVIIVPSGLIQEDVKLTIKTPSPEQTAEKNRRYLRDSVHDLAQYLEKMSGATIGVLDGLPADNKLPIYIGEAAAQKFGTITTHAPAGQAFRVVVKPDGIGLYGENFQSTCYAIYEVLDRLGVRWMLPSEMGEVVPERKTIALPIGDTTSAPGTIGRFLWHLDPTYQRRVRMGGEGVAAGHALEIPADKNKERIPQRYGYLTRQQLAEHLAWNAMINSTRGINGRFCWGNTEVSDAVADAIIAKLDAGSDQRQFSLSPNDGSTFCECDLCKALDAGDFDPVMNTMSITDRFVNFANRIATRVTKKYPDVRFGFLAYVQYTQPPVREKLHPNLAVQLAPINYCRAHAMTDNCPSRQHMRRIVENWAKAAPAGISYYQYMYNLAEYSAPYPMLHQMTVEQPIIYGNNVKYWQPEGMTNLDQILPAHYVSNRMAWNPKADPQRILDEFFLLFYGSAAAPMRKYWTLWDEAWTKVDEHAGANWAYARRFTPEFLEQARAAMDEALAAAKTNKEKFRVQMQDENLKQITRMMQLRFDLNEGRLTNLGPDSKAWLDRQIELGNEYSPQGAFSKIRWTPHTAAGHWFFKYMQPPYLDASHISENHNWVSPPLRNWKYQQDKENTGEISGWGKPDFNDAEWKTTDVGTETWSTMGLADYFGAVWYRVNVKFKDLPAGKKTFLWISATDGAARVWINGVRVPYRNSDGTPVLDKQGKEIEVPNSYGKPFSFEITNALKPNATNQIAIEATHTFINELGTGGLLGPVYLYQEK